MRVCIRQTERGRERQRRETKEIDIPKEINREELREHRQRENTHTHTHTHIFTDSEREGTHDRK